MQLMNLAFMKYWIVLLHYISLLALTFSLCTQLQKWRLPFEPSIDKKQKWLQAFFDPEKSKMNLKITQGSK